MWARGAVVVNCVLGYVMLIGGGAAAAGFSPFGVSLFWEGGLGGLSWSGCLARGDWYFLVLFSGCLGLWRGGGGLWAVSKIESSARLHCLPRFILLVISSDILLVVSILDIV